MFIYNHIKKCTWILNIFVLFSIYVPFLLCEHKHKSTEMCVCADLRRSCPHYEILMRKHLNHYIEYSFWKRIFLTQQGMSLEETNSVSSGLMVTGTPSRPNRTSFADVLELSF